MSYLKYFQTPSHILHLWLLSSQGMFRMENVKQRYLDTVTALETNAKGITA